ncbi:D-amino acid dehydrogenase small subunit [Shimia sp. SK013]|uniref:NAD(P)/FAD-dependent oxidoreductase n=1 Tax=Shimia sp. SK013 TaxID=1389006 RepID=UPI0006B48297|nr:FAD-dependent oxidoreductase [Shimia sp. SK013]KPA20762.1 D-amino acid dehydrogenase small subunit [Shimia sp. SK013]
MKNTPRSKSYDATVIGAGIIGVSAALALQGRGLSVCLMDRQGVAAGASQGNAGAFAFSDIEPLATPGILRKAPRWLFDPLGPLSIPPTYAPRITPWMLRFWRASWQDRYAAAVTAQIALMTLSRAALERQISDVGGAPFLQHEGQLQLYEGTAQFAASQAGWALRRAHGIAFELLESPEAIADIQPGLAHQFTHAVFTPDWLNTVNPLSWAQHLARTFVNRGGTIETQNVVDLQHDAGTVTLQTEAGTVSSRKAVIAAGAWSHQLTRQLGDRLPLETERGYNTTLPAGAFDLRTHLTFGRHGFVVTKIDGDVRVGGAVELGGLHRKPDFRRAKFLLDKAAQFLPDLDTSNGTQWMGFRPSMPDSLPVIGPSSATPNVIYAFGHGHLGLTQSAATAELVADLATRHTPAIDLRAYAPSRF